MSREALARRPALTITKGNFVMTVSTVSESASRFNYGTITCVDCGMIVKATGTRQKLCSACSRERKRAADRAYVARDPERNRAKARQWAAENKDRVSQRNRAKRLADPEATKACAKLRYDREREKRKAAARAWYADNREKVLARMATPKGRAYSAAKMHERLATNPQFRLHSNVSSAIRARLRGKSQSWPLILGYSAADLVTHLERQFLRGMSWDNYGAGKGRWHIDHIRPQSSFTFEDESDPAFKECWALTNLRPLWGVDNIRKHASREFLI